MSPEQARLRALLREPRYRGLAAELKATAWWFDDEEDADTTGVAFVDGAEVGARGAIDLEAGVVVVVGAVRAACLLVAGASSESTVIFLDPVRARDLVLASDTNAYCASALEVTDLMFVASPDASFTTLADAAIGVLYSGHSAAWLTARGKTTIGVLDDYVEGKRPTVARKKVSAAELVRPALRHETRPERLDRDTVLAAASDGLPMLIATPAPNPALTPKPAPKLKPAPKPKQKPKPKLKPKPKPRPRP